MGTKVGGENALVYLPIGTELPERNSWSLDITRELREAKVFQAGTDLWVENAAGYKSWSGAINGFYDAASEAAVTASHGASGLQTLLLYEDRDSAGKYWYGTVWADMTEDVTVDGFIELNVTFTGSGALQRFSS